MMFATSRDRSAIPRSPLEKFIAMNWLLIAALCVLAGIGTATLYSVSGGSLAPWADRHIVRFLLAMAALFAIAIVPLRWWLQLSYPVYIVALVLLALVPLFGTDAMGAKRWLNAGPIIFQPSEIMKIALLAMLAAYYQSIRANRLSRPLYVLFPLIATLLPVGLTVLQPDLGTATILLATGLGVMWLAGVHVIYFVVLAGGALVSVPAIWAQLHDYQKARLEVFFDPGRDPLGAGYHIAQSKIALGSGGLTGKGYLQGTQGQLGFLPEKHTDFIFTNFAEEWGFAGSIVILGLFGFVQILLLLMGLTCKSTYARLLVGGAALIVFLHAGTNIAMVTGLVPVVGIPLPFISYGGTALITLTAALGLAMCGYVNRNVVDPRFMG